jgi:hypothetical protein
LPRSIFLADPSRFFDSNECLIHFFVINSQVKVYVGPFVDAVEGCGASFIEGVDMIEWF